MSAEASSSTPRPAPNPQLGSSPWFTYPTPTPEELEDELPPYFEEENVPLGGLLERLTRKGYGDMKELVEVTLDQRGLTSRHRAQHVVNYAKATRHNILKYLAILRWKQSVDIPYAPTQAFSLVTNAHTQPSPQNPLLNGASQFPTPLSNDQSPAAASYVGKGKAKAVDLNLGLDVVSSGVELERKGKVTDAKRIAVFMEHQNRQHDEAVGHLKFQASVVDSFRERNPDILTALSLLTQGTYTRLPTSLTKTFLPQTPLTNYSLLRTLRRLNKHLLYRIRCVDHLPPELELLYIRDGRARLQGGKGGWRVDVTVVGFGDESRWWMVGLEWGWRVKEKGVDDPGGGIRRFEGEERQGILDLVNGEILAAKETSKKQDVSVGIAVALVGQKPTGVGVDGILEATGTPQAIGSVVGSPATATREGIQVAEETSSSLPAHQPIDAPLIRLHNFIQHLSLSYQLEVLFTQAMTLSQGRWRGNLLVEIDRNTKVMQARYWVRARVGPTVVQGQVAVGKRQAAAVPRTPLVGGTLSISLEELKTREGGELSDLMGLISLSGSTTRERILNLGLKIRWDVGEIGAGGGLKFGDSMDVSDLIIDAKALDFEDLLLTATRTHASHLTRHVTQPLLSSPQIALFPLDPPSLVSSQDRPISLHIPLPSRIAAKRAKLIIGVSALTGLTKIGDEGKGENRQERAKLVEKGVNAEGRKLVDDVGRLMKAIITESLENQMRQFGWEPLRRLPLRSQDLAKNDLHPASSVFVPLPTSPLHYLTARVTPLGLTFELLRLSRVAVEGGASGTKMVVGDRTGVEVQKLRERRAEKRKGKGKAKEENTLDMRSSFEVEDRDLQDMYIFCNALVAQTIVEQQLKDRSIPYTLQYPASTGPTAPSGTSAVAGMVPTLCVNAKDLFKDGRAGEVAMPKVYIQLRDWWKGGRVTTLTVVQLRHKPALTPGKDGSARDDTPESGTEGIKFDPLNSTVRFKAEEIGRCVPAFLEQWERLSKVIVIAGEVNRLNKLPRFNTLRMLSFDLKTATFVYHPGYTVTVTYSPLDDSYEVTFGRENRVAAGVGEGEGEGGDGDGDESDGGDGGMGMDNPHERMQGLLGYKLNELVETRKKGDVGLEFISLLCDTLLFLLECQVIEGSRREKAKGLGTGIHDIHPVVVIRAVTAFKLVWDVDGSRRFIVDFILLPPHRGGASRLGNGHENRGGRYLVRDAFETGDESCGPLTAIPGFEGIVTTLWEGLRSVNADKGGRVAMKMDGGKSLVVKVEDIRGVVGEVVREVDRVLGS